MAAEHPFIGLLRGVIEAKGRNLAARINESPHAPTIARALATFKKGHVEGCTAAKANATAQEKIDCTCIAQRTVETIDIISQAAGKKA